MGFLLRDVLRRLCVEIGWSYAVFWRAIGCRNPKKLVWEDGHCERLPSISGFDAMDMLLKEKGLARGCANDWYAEVGSQAEDKLSMLFKKMMVSQVHVVGEGLVGRAVLTGHHQWILRDTLGVSSSDTSVEMKAQFFAGIQTIAIIPVLPFGVVQLGSTQTVIENMGFINQVRCLFAQLGSVSGTFTSDVTQKTFSKSSIAQASPAVPSVTCPSGEFGAQAVRSLPAISGRLSHHQPDQRSTSLRTAKQPCGSTAVHFNVKSDSGVSKVTPANMATGATQAAHSKMLLQVSDRIVKPAHLNSQLECHSSKAQVSLTDPGIRFNQQAAEYSLRSGFESNSLAVASDLRSSSFVVPGKLPTPSSNSGPSEKKSTISNSESVQIRSCRSKGSYQQTGSDTGSFYGRKGQFSGYVFGETSSFPVDNKVRVKSSNDIPSGNERNFMTNNKINNSDGNQVISKDSMSTHLVKKDFQNLVAAGKEDHGNDLFQSIGVLPAEFGKYGPSYDPLGTPLQSDCWTSSSNPFEEKQRFLNGGSIVNGQEKFLEEPCFMDSLDEKSTKLIQSGSGNDLFDALGIEYRLSHFNAHELDTDVSTCITPSDTGPFFDSLNHEDSCTDIFLENYHDQLLDAVVSKAKSGAKQNSDDDVSCRTSITNISSSFHGSSSASGWVASSAQTGTNTSGLLRMLSKSEPTIYNTSKSACSSDKTEECSMSEPYRTPIIPWVDNGRNIKSGRASSAQCKRVDDIGKLTRKRARPGESPRPRPKDRQMIQDRVKELREIVPNGAKCSIDALLEKTIKHMLFLQSVTKHADKLKETGEPKIISKEGGLLLKDRFESGATWAVEVGNQSMICPIIVEDLNAPRQMLVEMLCEERGFFLEIADLIRGMGLNILKGVMEARDDKIWARFVAEANRDVTRMEIFLSLVHLLEPTMGTHITPAGVTNLATPQMPAPPSSLPANVISDSFV